MLQTAVYPTDFLKCVYDLHCICHATLEICHGMGNKLRWANPKSKAGVDMSRAEWKATKQKATDAPLNIKPGTKILIGHHPRCG